MLDIAVQALIDPAPGGGFGGGGRSENNNYQMSIHGNQAWVSHEETSYTPEGEKRDSYEIRMLEKVGGQWKLVGQSIHLKND